jgi:hypothetical protein
VGLVRGFMAVRRRPQSTKSPQTNRPDPFALSLGFARAAVGLLRCVAVFLGRFGEAPRFGVTFLGFAGMVADGGLQVRVQKEELE